MHFTHPGIPPGSEAGILKDKLGGRGGGRKEGMMGRVGVGNRSNIGVLDICALHKCGTESSVPSLVLLSLSREAHSMTTQGRLAMLGRPKCLTA